MLAIVRARLGAELEALSGKMMVRLEAASPTDEPYRLGESAEWQTIEQRIRLLGQLVAGLSAVDPVYLWPDRIGYGSMVRVLDLSDGTEQEYTLLLADAMEVEDGQVSLESPIGNALLGRRVGDEVAVRTPRGMRRLAIRSVLTLPQALAIAGNGGGATHARRSSAPESRVLANATTMG